MIRPWAEKKNFLDVIHRQKFVSAPAAQQVHPQAEQESIFRTFLLWQEDLEQ